MTNMVTRSVERLLILRENADPPSDAEWDECLDLLAAYRSDFSKVRVLVLTDGGGPTQAQRRRLNATSAGQPIHVSVVTDSIKVRFIVSSVALFLREIASFRVSEMSEAFDHLGLDRHEVAVAEKALAEMTNGVTNPRRFTEMSYRR